MFKECSGMKLDVEPRSQTHPSGSTGIPENESGGGGGISQHGSLPDLRVSHYHGLPAQFLEPKKLKTGFSTGMYFQSLGLEGNGHLRTLISAFAILEERACVLPGRALLREPYNRQLDILPVSLF